MGESLGKIIAIGLAGILMFIFPLMETLQRQDDVAQTSVLSATVKFVDDVRNMRKLTQERYSSYITEISATGNSFASELEHKILDENVARKAPLTGKDKIGENIYYTKYTTQILDEGLYQDTSNGMYNLKQGDLFSAKVVNTNRTIGTIMQQFLFRNDASAYKIVASHGGMVM